MTSYRRRGVTRPSQDRTTAVRSATGVGTVVTPAMYWQLMGWSCAQQAGEPVR